jgi:hypothetical protein
MENTEENGEKIGKIQKKIMKNWKIQKKGKLNNEKIGKILKKGKLNSEKIGKISRKPRLNKDKI